MKIGEVAHSLGVAPHVLRHWERMGVVVPDRTPSGHRDYSEQHICRLSVLRTCQAVGMSLSEIRQVLDKDEYERVGAVKRQLRRIRAQRVQLREAERFLLHVMNCERTLRTACGTCMRYAARLPLR
ncbi:MerR family transcriptional regulator [Nocardia sp. AB354]|uniref:helix-turn-helix domain-containing protein n=1 Tax=Nocardia sp. AB354 TaxID=3413283 RepID=UPI003C22F2B7